MSFQDLYVNMGIFRGK